MWNNGTKIVVYLTLLDHETVEETDVHETKVLLTNKGPGTNRLLTQRGWLSISCFKELEIWRFPDGASGLGYKECLSSTNEKRW